MRVLVACECSGVVRDAFLALGHDAVSCDLEPSENPIPFRHLQCDAIAVLNQHWDLMIAHPPCTYLTNAGVRWLDRGANRERMEKMRQAAEFYKALWNAPIERIAVENPVMHPYAVDAIGISQKRQIIQPWHFGEPMFKATGFLLKNLPPLVETYRLIPPKIGTPEHKAWSWVHRCPPGPDRAKIRSRTPLGPALAMAAQWGAL